MSRFLASSCNRRALPFLFYWVPIFFSASLHELLDIYHLTVNLSKFNRFLEQCLATSSLFPDEFFWRSPIWIENTLFGRVFKCSPVHCPLPITLQRFPRSYHHVVIFLLSLFSRQIFFFNRNWSLSFNNTRVSLSLNSLLVTLSLKSLVSLPPTPPVIFSRIHSTLCLTLIFQTDVQFW